MTEAAKWIGRVLDLLPAIAKLWEAVDADDEDLTLEAQLDLTRAMKDRQARETIGVKP